jgi:signal transduction histidine kinase
VINAQYQDGFTCSVEKQKYQIEVKSTVKSKEASSYIETIRDITRFEKLNEQLRRTERLATIGTMVAGIAHEMNNPLSGISGNSQLMLRTPEKYGLNTKGSNRIGTIFQSAQRATLIMKDLLSFSNPSEIHFQSINVASLLRDTLAEFNTEPILNISLAPSSSQQHLEVWGDFYQLKSAVKKIIENSIQAVNEQAKSTPEFTGRINIETQNQDNIIIIKVTDNGCGFPEEKLAMVFDPFFTTKDPGKGVGLGLSICHRIITEHFGHIKIQNLDPGAQVLIYLPSERPVETRF